MIVTKKRVPPMQLVGAIVAFLASILVGCIVIELITGYSRRSYSYLAEDAEVEFQGSTTPVSVLAERYKPEFFLPEHGSSPPALALWWEAIEDGETIALVYHPVWEDEEHPLPFIHWPYYLYRAIVYGIPVRDIEYFQVNIARADGAVVRVRYEGSTATGFYDALSRHRYITVERRPEGYVESARDRRDGAVISRTVSSVSAPPQVGIATWSHQFELLTEPRAHYSKPVPMDLEYLTDDLYQRHKLSRRSQGDYATQPGVFERWIRPVVLIAFMALPYLLVRLLSLRQPRVSA